MHYTHLFGPVNSRRLGISLGIDMVPFKTCNCNCVYCECGGAAPIAGERREYIPVKELIAELDHFLASGPKLDYVTFAGSGEPTLNTALGTVLRFVKGRYPGYKTALLTNGTTMYLPEVREELLPFDLILPSLDAVSEKVFREINRPGRNLILDHIIEGLIEFSHQFAGQLWIEVFIVPGINDTPEELARFKEIFNRMRFDRLQLNSLDRPGACEWVQAATPERLTDIAHRLHPLPVEIIARHAGETLASEPPPDNLAAAILHQLLRRPATIEEIAVVCSVTINDILPLLQKLATENKITTSNVNGRTFYAVLAPK